MVFKQSLKSIYISLFHYYRYPQFNSIQVKLKLSQTVINSTEGSEKNRIHVGAKSPRLHLHLQNQL